MRVSEAFRPSFDIDEMPINPRVVLGANNPPTPIDDSRSTYKLIAQFLKDNPVVENETTALSANETLAIGRSTLKALEIAEGAEADPLYSQWKAAKAKYKPAIDGMKKIVDEVASRLTEFMRAEQRRRQQEADEKRRVAEEAERAAREAERLEAEARENASVGEVGVDVAGAIEQADTAFDAFKKTAREATLAEKDANVRFKSRFAAKATTLRMVKTLVLTDATKALAIMGVTPKIEEALLSSARDYRKTNNLLPDGVTETETQTL